MVVCVGGASLFMFLFVFLLVVCLCASCCYCLYVRVDACVVVVVVVVCMCLGCCGCSVSFSVEIFFVLFTNLGQASQYSVENKLVNCHIEFNIPLCIFYCPNGQHSCRVSQ